MKRLLYIALLVAIVLPTILATGCSSSTGAPMNDGQMGGAAQIKMAPMSMLDADIQSAPTTVREAYQFALANADALKNVPCYCGCGAIGHTSNYSCFVKNVNSDGKVVFDRHALGCSICVDIAQDVMKLSKQGQSPGQIHSAIVSTYSQYGPGNQ